MLELFAQLVAGMLFGRVDGTSLVEQPLRRRLLGLIADRPGIHASELARESGAPWGTVQYHLSLLHKGALVNSVEAGRERRFFSLTVDPVRARLLSILDQGRRKDIALYIREHPGVRQVEVCKSMDVSRKTFRSSIGPLVDEGLIQEHRGLQANRYFPGDTLDRALRESERMAHGPESVSHSTGLEFV